MLELVELLWYEARARDKELFIHMYEDEITDFPGLRDTARWKKLRREMGVSEAQLAAVEFEMPNLGPG